MVRWIGLVLAAALVGACTSGPPATASGSPAASSASESTEPSPVASPTPGIEIRRDLAYASIDAGGTPMELALDLYLPPGGPHPVVVIVHGGGWAEGEKDGCPGEQLAGFGYAAACIEYRLAQPDCSAWARFPGAVRDVRWSVEWLRQHAEEHRLDPDRIALLGDSAGGHLAALTGLSYGVAELGFPDDVDAAPVQAIVDWFGPTDALADPIQYEDAPCDTTLEALQATYGENIYTTWYWSLFLGGGFGDPEVLERAALARPADHADATDPPVLVMHGDADPIVNISQSELLVERLQAANVDVTYVAVPGAGHQWSSPSGPENVIADEFLTPTLEFLDRTLGG